MEINVKRFVSYGISEKHFTRKDNVCKNIIKYIFLIPKNIYWIRLRRLQDRYVFQTRLIEIWHLQRIKKRMILCVSDMQQEV